ncbi:VOC family protein [Rubrivirga sp.]|uniref:VOC family protein n=1 Tax=Rubrivirga sp. TaxID=1885344 RepID=UPI003C7544D0
MSRLLALSAALLLSACASTDTARPAVELDHTALHVADLGASVEFYTSVFGIPEKPAPGDPTVIRWLDLGDAELHLINFDGEVPPTNKAIHFAFRVTDLDAVVARVEELGVPYSDWPGEASTISLRPDGIRQIYVQDPDGHWIEVNDV